MVDLCKPYGCADQLLKHMQQYYAVVRELGDITVDDLGPFSVTHAQC